MTFLRSLLVLPALLVALSVGESVAAAQPSPVVVNLTALNNSGLAGTATLTDIGGGKTRVDVQVSGPDGDYPAHIHMGTCANLTAAPQYPLTNVRGGTSTTEVNATLASIEQSPHAINLHKSTQDLATYVACGDIAASGPGTTANLTALNNSGLAGTATLTDIGGGKTRVDVQVSGPDGDYPAHIHMGTCANLTAAPQYPLTNVRGGTSTTEVNATLASIEQSPHAINLHQSAQDLATYVACGDLPVLAANLPAPPPQPAAASQPAPSSSAPRARDGQSLATQSAATQAMFTAVWGDRAASRWVQEHEAALAAGR